MIKFIYFFILFFLISYKSYSETISEIKIEGNKRITDDTIKLFSGVEKFKKKDLSENELNIFLKQLYETNFFENVTISINNGILIIKVKENPLIQTVKFVGIENKKILKALKENIELKERTSYLKNNVKKDEAKINNILKSAGYYFVEVDSIINQNENNTVDITYDITLGE